MCNDTQISLKTLPDYFPKIFLWYDEHFVFLKVKKPVSLVTSIFCSKKLIYYLCSKKRIYYRKLLESIPSPAKPDVTGPLTLTR